MAEFWYNSSPHSKLGGRSPFELLYGHAPRHFGIIDAAVSPVPDVEALLAEPETMLVAVRKHLLHKVFIFGN